jgi:hypothetical protein
VPVIDSFMSTRSAHNESVRLLLQREDVSGGTYRRFGMYNCSPEDVPLFEQGFDYFDSLATSSGLEY